MPLPGPTATASSLRAAALGLPGLLAPGPLGRPGTWEVPITATSFPAPPPTWEGREVPWSTLTLVASGFR